VAELTIWKYHGTGNDFVMLEDLAAQRPLSAELVRALCDRHRGVGADGVIRVTRADPSSGASFFMDYWNADGSVAEMCGNGIRCLAKLVVERALTTDTELDVDTRAGVKHLSIETVGGVVRSVTVGMGPARLARRDIPMTGGDPGQRFLLEPFEVGGRTYKASAVSMGNPHLVLFVEEDPADVDVTRLGPIVEHDPRFPNKANVEFVAIEPDGGVRLRVWERGVGETMACGTGACAALVAANEAGLVARRAPVRYPGGELIVERLDDQVRLTGPAQRVFEARLDTAWLAARGLT
jgi:diaminopimelate epimerase